MQGHLIVAVIISFQIRGAVLAGVLPVADQRPGGPTVDQVSAAVGGLGQLIQLHELYGVVVERFAFPGLGAVRAVYVSLTVELEGQVGEVVIFDLVLICVQLGLEGDESGVDGLEFVGVGDAVVLAVAVAALAVTQADAGEELVVSHRHDQLQVPVAVEGDGVGTDGFEALGNGSDVAAAAESCAGDCFHAVQSGDEVGLTLQGDALLDVADLSVLVDEFGEIVILCFVFAGGQVVSLVAVLLMELGGGLCCGDAVFLGVQADVVTAVIDRDVVVESVAVPDNFFCLFFNFLFDLFFDLFFDRFFECFLNRCSDLFDVGGFFLDGLVLFSFFRGLFLDGFVLFSFFGGLFFDGLVLFSFFGGLFLGGVVLFGFFGGLFLNGFVLFSFFGGLFLGGFVLFSFFGGFFLDGFVLFSFFGGLFLDGFVLFAFFFGDLFFNRLIFCFLIFLLEIFDHEFFLVLTLFLVILVTVVSVVMAVLEPVLVPFMAVTITVVIVFGVIVVVGERSYGEGIHHQQRCGCQG